MPPNFVIDLDSPDLQADVLSEPTLHTTNFELEMLSWCKEHELAQLPWITCTYRPYSCYTLIEPIRKVLLGLIQSLNLCIQMTHRTVPRLLLIHSQFYRFYQAPANTQVNCIPCSLMVPFFSPASCMNTHSDDQFQCRQAWPQGRFCLHDSKQLRSQSTRLSLPDDRRTTRFLLQQIRAFHQMHGTCRHDLPYTARSLSYHKSTHLHYL